MAGMKRVSDQIAFRSRVERVVKKLDIDEPRVFFDAKDSADDEFTDDGSLHIRRSGMRVVFNVSNHQNAEGAEQNRQTRAIMEALNMKRKITDRVLVDEDEEGSTTQ